jgi:DMSO/TMAO reductase YedYZ molybdopterin-dependent catalytic subunit
MMPAFIASVALSAISLFARVLFGVPSPLEKLYNTLTFWLGTPQMFQLVHQLLGFGEAGKIMAFIGSSLLFIGGITLLGLRGILPATIAVGLVSLLLLFSSQGISAVIWAAAYAGLYYLIVRALQPLQTDTSRRGTLKTLTGGAVGVLGLGAFGILQPLFRGSSVVAASAVDTNVPKLPDGIVSQKDLYYVSINNEILDPKLKEETWSLELTGMVKNPQKFKLQELKDSFKPQDLEFTMSCISNPVGGTLIGNCIWRGLRVRDLLEKVGIESGAKWITWEAADGFYESLPLGQALEENVLLAYFINGEPLNDKHGFPLRLILPGHYGMKQPRWMTKITLSSEERLGYWANRGWSKTAYIQPHSRIDNLPKLKAGVVATLRGIAYAGIHEIEKVEISTDGGQTWNSANLEKRARYAWTRWSLAWTPSSGNHQLIVRCYAQGQVQTEEIRDSLPEAASGWHKMGVFVA